MIFLNVWYYLLVIYGKYIIKINLGLGIKWMYLLNFYLLFG